ncbi:ABC transporter permease [Clostridium senegalense]|uniref:ABC transporter permease n=1 Tax=Clostridium senegalense TaxID=1465809 RepID=UPI0002FC27FC|nr:ABC transporter permease [Clostridium senegalense]
MIRATFIIFASVLLAKLIIEEYKNNTITILFMYPINRKKLIMAKLIIVASFTFVTTVLSNIFIDSALCIINNFYNFTTDKITVSLIINSFRNIFISGLLSAGISLIPLYFGMKKKSVPTTIISAIIIVSIVCSNGNGISLNSIIAVPITLALIGVFIAYLSIKNIEHVDINK